MIGRIYRIIHLESEICYIGSTFNELRYRWQNHKQNYKSWLKNKYGETTIYPYFKQYGIDNFKIVLVKEYEVVDKTHLSVYEQLWINNFRKTSVNINNPFYIKKVYKKQYYNLNKTKIESKVSQKIKCECGVEFRLNNKARHFKSIKHIKYVEQQG